MASAFQDPRAPPTCEHCGNETEDIRRCSVRSNKNLCDGCFQKLPGARRDDIGDPEWVCKNHLDRKVEVFCKTCKCGYCMECARDDHKDDDVVNVQELVQKTREDLLTQLQWVDAKAEKLSELEMKITNTIRNVEEPGRFVDTTVDEIKNEIEQKLENDIRLLQEKSQRDMQRIEEIHLDLKAILLKDEETRKCRIQETNKDLLVGQQACKCAKEDIKTLLESNPETLIKRGIERISLVKASLAFPHERNVVNCCREVEDTLPQLKEAKHDFHTGARPHPLFKKIQLCLAFTILWVVVVNRGMISVYNIFLSCRSRGFDVNIVNPLLYVFMALAFIWSVECSILMWILLPTWEYDFPFKTRRSFTKEMIFYKKMITLILECVGIAIIIFLLLMGCFSFLNIITEDATSVSLILTSCISMYYLRTSKRCKDFCDYTKVQCFLKPSNRHILIQVIMRLLSIGIFLFIYFIFFASSLGLRFVKYRAYKAKFRYLRQARIQG